MYKKKFETKKNRHSPGDGGPLRQQRHCHEQLQRDEDAHHQQHQAKGGVHDEQEQRQGVPRYPKTWIIANGI